LIIERRLFNQTENSARTYLFFFIKLHNFKKNTEILTFRQQPINILQVRIYPLQGTKQYVE